MYEKSFFTKSPTSSFQKLLSCHDGRKCIRLQIFSDNFCSDRAVFRSVGSSQSISRADVIKTTILVGVWPPQKSVFFHGTIRNRTRIRFGPKSFPRLDEDYGCVYDRHFPIGVTNVGAPASMYKVAAHTSWYQGLRHGSNDYCASDPK